MEPEEMEQIKDDFRRMIHRPFSRPESWKTAEPNMKRLRMALTRGDFVCDVDTVKNIIQSSHREVWNQ